MQRHNQQWRAASDGLRTCELLLHQPPQSPDCACWLSHSLAMLDRQHWCQICHQYWEILKEQMHLPTGHKRTRTQLTQGVSCQGHHSDHQKTTLQQISSWHQLVYAYCLTLVVCPYACMHVCSCSGGCTYVHVQNACEVVITCEQQCECQWLLPM